MESTRAHRIVCAGQHASLERSGRQTQDGLAARRSVSAEGVTVRQHEYHVEAVINRVSKKQNEGPLATARLAQSAERKALNLVVVGSSPTVGVIACADQYPLLEIPICPPSSGDGGQRS